MSNYATTTKRERALEVRLELVRLAYEAYRKLFGTPSLFDGNLGPAERAYWIGYTEALVQAAARVEAQEGDRRTKKAMLRYAWGQVMSLVENPGGVSTFRNGMIEGYAKAARIIETYMEQR